MYLLTITNLMLQHINQISSIPWPAELKYDAMSYGLSSGWKAVWCSSNWHQCSKSIFSSVWHHSKWHHKCKQMISEWCPNPCKHNSN